MPYTVNGIGTHYYGKGNKVVRSAACPHCGHAADLTSYDTWHCLCVLFIPVLPIGRHRILDQCSVCSRHRVIKLSAWNEMNQLAIPEAVMQWEREPSKDSALSAHMALMVGQKFDAAKEIRDEALAELPGEAASLHANLGWQFHELSDYNAAKESFETADQMDSELPEVRAGVGLYALMENNIEKGVEKLSFLDQDGSGGDPHFHLLDPLVNVLADQNKFESALQYSDRLLKERPDLFEVDALRKRHAKLEKKAGRTISNLPPRERSSLAVLNWRDQSVDSGKRKLVYGLIGSLLIFAVGAFASSWIGSHRTLHVLAPMEIANPEAGLHLELTIDDGEPITLTEPSSQITIAEGKHRAVLRNLDADTQLETEWTMQTSPWTRIFSSPHWVFNAGGSHQVLKVVYARVPRGPQENLVVKFGAHHYPSIDYFFTTAPDTMSVSENRSSVTKTQLNPLPIEFLTAPAYLNLAGETAKGNELARSYLDLFPDRPGLLMAIQQATALSGTERQMFAKLKERLDAYPADFEVHSAITDLIDLDNQTEIDEVVARYDRWTTEHPDDATVQVLSSLFAPTQSERLQRLDRAFEIDPNFAPLFAQRTAAYLSLGDFERVIQSAAAHEQVTGEPNDFTITSRTHIVNLALGKRAEMMKEIEASGDLAQTFFPNNVLYIDLLTLSGRDGDAKIRANRIADDAVNAGVPLLGDMMVLSARNILGDKSLKINNAVRNDEVAFQQELVCALYKLNEKDLMSLARRADRAAIISQFQLAIGLAALGQDEIANQQRTKAVERMSKSVPRYRHLAKLISSDEVLTQSDLDDLNLSLTDKLFVMIDQSLQHPTAGDFATEFIDKFAVSGLVHQRAVRTVAIKAGLNVQPAK